MRTLFLLLFIITAIKGSAQTESYIREHYTKINSQITESVEQGFEGPLYNNQWINNKNGRSWPAVGNYSDTINFWYDDPPYHLSAAERSPKKMCW